MIFGGIEAGGTKFVCGVGDAQWGSLEHCVFPTRDPDTTLGEVRRFLQDASDRHGKLDALGIASFGPLDLDRASPAFGHLLRTPKQGWSGIDLATAFSGLAVPIAIDTDVNAAAIAEACAHDVGSVAYITVGTGVGVGLVLEGKAVHGLGHPEAGHTRPRRHPSHNGFAGLCPYHQDCYEGLVSGPAIAAAWGAPLSALAEGHVAWEATAHYLGQLCASLVLTVAPQRIVMGGGVMKQTRLFGAIQREVHAQLAGYVDGLSTLESVAALIVPPACVEPSGLIGAHRIAESCGL